MQEQALGAVLQIEQDRCDRVGGVQVRVKVMHKLVLFCSFCLPGC